MSNIVHVDDKLESPTYDKIKKIEEVGKLHVKGYSNSDIAEYLSIRPATVKVYVNEYLAILRKTSEENPFFLEEVQYNTLKALEGMNEVSKEAWETVEIATENGMVSARIQALKLAGDMEDKKAKLLKLMGGNGPDGEYLARMQKAESVNILLSQVIKEVIADCEHCRMKARARLQEAFAMMESEGFDDPQQAADHLDFEEAEIVED